METFERYLVEYFILFHLFMLFTRLAKIVSVVLTKYGRENWLTTAGLCSTHESCCR